MKKILFFLFVFLTITGLNASDWVRIQSNEPSPAQINLINSNISTSTVQFSLDGFWKNLVETERGTAWMISLDKGAEMLKKSAPELPVFTSSLIVPDQAAMSVDVISADFIEIHDVLVAPSKGNFSRQIDPATIPFEFGKYYDRDGDFPGELAKLNDPYIVRDYRGQALVFQPFQYNPVTKTLKIYYNITVQVNENGISDFNVIERNQPIEKINSSFKHLYSRHFLNYNSSQRYDPVEEEGNMIIISYGDFMDEVQPLADWKIQKGTPCTVVDVANIGGAPDIKDFIESAYNFSGLTFVLLVGDAAQVPTSNVQGNDSDNDYTYVDGNDHYPDLFIGRFSAQNEEDVTTMVDRTLAYEIDPVTDTAWYTKAIGIGSNEGPGDDNEMDYEHLRNIANNKLIPFTYNFAYEFFDGSQGGEDENGNPTPAMVATAVNSGATIINYTGHGSTTAWSSSGFSVSNVNSLTNVGKWPFIISVACVNGNFVNNTCFAEAWTRASDDGEPTGAIATLMSTINQSWNPPMHGQDEMNDILTEAYEDNIKRTFGGITMNGCMAMNDAYGSNGMQETDCWTIFGDPSVFVRTAIPADMTVSHISSVSVGETSLSVSCDAEGGLAVLSMDGDILGKAYVEEGEAIIEFDALTNVGAADVVVTAFNYRPYIGSIEVVTASAPFITYVGHIVNDIKGNENELIDYAEEIYFTIDLANIGDEDADGVVAILSTNSPYIELVIDSSDYGAIAAGDTVSVVDAYTFNVAEDIPDGELIEFMVTAEDLEGRSVWQSDFSVAAHAPLLEYVSYSIDDEIGDGNGKIDPGETVDLILDLANLGSAAAYNVAASLSTESEYVSINDPQQFLGNLEGGSNSQLIFKISADGDTPEGYSANFTLELIADHNISGGGDFYTIVGQKPVLIINLSNDNTASDSIANCMNMLQVGADYATELPEDRDVYKSIFIVLGVYPDNNALTPKQGDDLALFLENGGSIYMEGGDAWAFDEPTAVHEMFYIEGLNDGEDNLSAILGEPDGFLYGYNCLYNGPNNYIDQIAPRNESTLILSNEDPSFGVAVSYQNETYKTIGSSISFSGLVDNEEYSKAGMMAEILSFFNIGFTWTDINERSIIEVETSAYPNPFSNEVSIAFSLSEKSIVSLDIFDLTGRKVRTIVNSVLSQGNHKYIWKATDSSGLKMQPGIYFYNLRSGNQVVTKKLILAY